VRHLCLDEVYFREPRRYLTVLSDAGRGTALGVEEGRGYAPSSHLLRRLPAEVRAQVETLATDLNWGQRKAALELLPHAEVAADCFHLVRLARNTLRHSQASQRPAARLAVRELLAILRGRNHPALHPWVVRWKHAAGPLLTLVTTVSRWELEIETYLLTGRSTGPAEALNRKIALLRRRACGYTNRDNFIGMILSLQPSSHHKE
jgi:transposase